LRADAVEFDLDRPAVGRRTGAPRSSAASARGSAAAPLAWRPYATSALAARRDPAYERAATKWLARFARERPAAGLDDVKTALDALLLLRDRRAHAHHALRMLAARHRLGDVIGLTDTPGTTAHDSDISRQR
jgi:hypothetical protein